MLLSKQNWEYLQREVRAMHEVWDELLEQDRLSCPCLAITANQLDHLEVFSEKHIRGGLGPEDPIADV